MKKRITIDNMTGVPVLIQAGAVDNDSVVDIGSLLYIDDKYIAIKSMLDGRTIDYSLDATKSKPLFGQDLIIYLQRFPKYKG